MDLCHPGFPCQPFRSIHVLYQDPELGISFNIRVFHLKVSISLEGTGQSIVLIKFLLKFKHCFVLSKVTKSSKLAFLLRAD